MAKCLFGVQLWSAVTHLFIMPGVKSLSRICWLSCAILQIGLISAMAQDTPLPDAPQPQNQPKQSNPEHNGQRHRPSPNHIFWVIPNYRSDESDAPFKPLTSGAKMKIAVDDSFDPSAFLVAGVLAGMSMAEAQYRPFGNGVAGFGKYYAAAFADQAIGNIMTEGLFPVALKQDPRYFVKGKGGFWKRTGYAISREVVTRADNGTNQFNTSEIAGNFVAAGIADAYYPSEDRTFSKTADKWGQQLALDTLFNVLKEFWPDVRSKFFGQ